MPLSAIYEPGTRRGKKTAPEASPLSPRPGVSDGGTEIPPRLDGRLVGATGYGAGQDAQPRFARFDGRSAGATGPGAGTDAPQCFNGRSADIAISIEKVIVANSVDTGGRQNAAPAKSCKRAFCNCRGGPHNDASTLFTTITIENRLQTSSESARSRAFRARFQPVSKRNAHISGPVAGPAAHPRFYGRSPGAPGPCAWPAAPPAAAFYAAGVVLSLCFAALFFRVRGPSAGHLYALQCCALNAFLAAIAVRDLRSGLIPNKWLACMAGAWALTAAARAYGDPAAAPGVFAGSALGAALAGGLFLAAYALARGGLGAGDVKLAAAIGLYLGFRGVMPAVFLSMAAAAVGGVGMAAAGKTGRKTRVPLGPFMWLGTCASLLLAASTNPSLSF